MYPLHHSLNLSLPAVVAVYEQGGGKHITHNFVNACSSITRLSRFVAQVYGHYAGDLYSPLVASHPNHPKGPVASFLFLRREALVLSLDSLYSDPFVNAVALGKGLVLLQVSQSLLTLIGVAEPFHGHFCSVAAQLLTRSKSKKRTGSTSITADSSKRGRKHT